MGLRRNRQEFCSAEEDEGPNNTAEVFVASITFIPKDARFGYKISSSFLQTLTADEALSRIPTLSFCRMIANDSQVFSLVREGELDGLLTLLEGRQATLTDCDEEGRSLLSASLLDFQPIILLKCLYAEVCLLLLISKYMQISD